MQRIQEWWIKIQVQGINVQIIKEGDKRNEEEYQYNEGEDRRTQAASTGSSIHATMLFPGCQLMTTSYDTTRRFDSSLREIVYYSYWIVNQKMPGEKECCKEHQSKCDAEKCTTHECHDKECKCPESHCHEKKECCETKKD